MCFVNRGLTMLCGFALVMAFGAAAQARDFEMGGDNQYPYSIMAPEPGTHQRTPSHAVKPLAKSAHRHVMTARGSSGSVLPTPLPRTQAIPSEGRSIAATPALPQQQGPTILPGMNPIPNLPHGPETFQDRASRCAHQQGLYGVPATASNQYMSACSM